MTLLDAIYTELLKQERIAPRSEAVTKRNHFIPQFFQKGWSESDRVYALYKGNTTIQRANVRDIMMEKYLYSVRELTNPNIFEKLRCDIEEPLYKALSKMNDSNFDLNDEDSGNLLSLFLCSSPAMMQLYEDGIRLYDFNSGHKMEEWGIRAMTCSFMIHMVKTVGLRISNEYDFKIIRTDESMVLADYPVIQILDGEAIYSKVGYYSHSDQMILPLNPNTFLLATRKGANFETLDNITVSEINDLMLKSAHNVIIGQNEEDLVSTAKYPIGTTHKMLIPMPPQAIVMGNGAFSSIVKCDDEGIREEKVPGFSIIRPRIYTEYGFVFDDSKLSAADIFDL